MTRPGRGSVTVLTDSSRPGSATDPSRSMCGTEPPGASGWDSGGWGGPSPGGHQPALRPRGADGHQVTAVDGDLHAALLEQPGGRQTDQAGPCHGDVHVPSSLLGY